MSTTDFSHLSRLTDCSVREAWAHEAHHFTVWLSENLDRLSDVIGVDLEPEQREVPVGDFSADILARKQGTDPEEGRVLIENQLERTDHLHLGQIMTYLAGLDARMVIWIATEFREPHLSAVKWLNDNTGADFSFFAIKLRAVRIGDSPIAPVFDVLAKPNSWERTLREVAHKTQPSEEAAALAAIWEHYLARYPDDANVGIKVTRTTNIWLPVDDRVLISVWIGKTRAGLFLRPLAAGDPDLLEAYLAPAMSKLESELGVAANRKGSHFYARTRDGGWSTRETWDDTIDWLHGQVHHTAAVLRSILPASDKEAFAPD